MSIIDKILIYIYIIIIVTNSLIIYYLNNLEGVDCNCIINWRHSFLKIVSIIFLIIYSIILIISIKSPNTITLNDIGKGNSSHNIWLYVLYLTIPIYFTKYIILHTYIKDLNSTQCMCAISNQSKLNNFLHIWKWIPLTILSILMAIPAFIIIISIIL